MSRFTAISFLVATILVAGCATESKYSQFQMSGSQYSTDVKKRLRTAKLYNQLDTVMIADVIYNDMWLRNAWVEKLAKANRWDEKKKNEILSIQKNEDSQNAQFIVALYTSEEQWNDLVEKDSRWSIFLETKSGSLRPVSIKKVLLEKLPMRDDLPFNPRFRIFYKVDFQREKAGELPYNLVMSSGLGVVKLAWSRY